MNKESHTPTVISNTMKRVDKIQVGDIPVDIQESIRLFVSWYSTPIIGVADSIYSEDIHQIGSGTFVRFNDLFGVLTAGHVIRKLLSKKSNNFVGLGLAVLDYVHRFVIPLADLEFIECYKQGPDGPDIGIIIIPNNKVGTIARGRNFWNLQKNRNLAMSNIIGSANYIAVLSGCPSEYNKEVTPESGFKRTILFGGLSGATGIERTWERGPHDFLEVAVSYTEAEQNPLEFFGMSGAGLWKVIIEKLENGTLRNRDPFLAGSVYRQGLIVQKLRLIYCHGTKSIYNVICEKLQEFEDSLK